MTRRRFPDVPGVARVPWSPDRRFYLAADGKCMSCGAELEPGWHADHVDAYSRGAAIRGVA